MFPDLKNSLNFVCVHNVGKKQQEKAGPQDLSLLAKSLKAFASQSDSATFDISFQDLSTKKEPGNEIGFITIKNNVNDSEVKFHVGMSSDDHDNFSLLKVSCQESSNLYFSRDKELTEFDQLIKKMVGKLHEDTNSQFSYSTPEGILEDNHIQTFQDALSIGLGSDYAIIRQPDKQVQPGLEITNLDDENLEIQRKDHPLKPGASKELFSGDMLKRASTYDTYLRNVYTALLGQAA
jgi:hypothetical protein